MKRSGFVLLARAVFGLALGVAVCLQFTPASWTQQNSSASQPSAAASQASAVAAQSSAAASTQNAADAPGSKEDIEKFLDVMDTREMMENVLQAMTKQMQKIVHQQVQKQPNLPPDAEARLDKMMEDNVKNFPTEELIKTMIPVYQKHLTKGDVDGLVAFYSSTIGKKVLKEMPSMTSEAMQAASGLVQKLMADANERVQVEIAQMKKDDAAGAKKDATPTPN